MVLRVLSFVYDAFGISIEINLKLHLKLHQVATRYHYAEYIFLIPDDAVDRRKLGF